MLLFCVFFFAQGYYELLWLMFFFFYNICASGCTSSFLFSLIQSNDFQSLIQANYQFDELCFCFVLFFWKIKTLQINYFLFSNSGLKIIQFIQNTFRGQCVLFINRTIYLSIFILFQFQEKKWEFIELYRQQQPDKMNKAVLRWIHFNFNSHPSYLQSLAVRLRSSTLLWQQTWHDYRALTAYCKCVEVEKLIVWLCQSTFSLNWKPHFNIPSVLL